MMSLFQNSKRILAVIFLCFFFFIHCENNPSSLHQPSSLPSSSSISSTLSKKTLYLAIWSHSITPEVLSRFEAQTGIHVKISHFSSNEELLAKMQAGATGYDVIVPSDYMVEVMKNLHLLQELNLNLVTNYKNLDPSILKKNYDLNNKFSIPYSWGTTGLAIHKDLYSGTIKSWKELFTREDLQGKFTLLDDSREVIGAALKAKGYSLNSTHPQELKEAKKLLFQAKKGVKAFTSEPKMPLIQGEFAISHVFMSDALQANRMTHGKVHYFIPEEGSTLWIDNLAIPSSSTQSHEAHQLIQFLLEAKQSADLTKNILNAPANKLAFALLPIEIQKLSGLFPSKKILSHCEMIQDLGEALPLWDRVWTELKASH